MKLPNANIVKVAQKKIADYLLNREHPDNGGKADFFVALGFRRDDWQPLARSFSRLAITYSVTRRMESVHGNKYIVDGTLETPTGKSPRVRSIWIVESGETIPRLVTAYPHEED